MDTSLINLAQRFVEENFVEKPKVVAVLLRGSSVIGVHDEFVDLDFDLVVSDEFLQKRQPIAEETSFEGVEVCWGYKSLETIDAELRGWERDTDLWAYSTGKVMYDLTGKLKALLDKYKQYPKSVRLEKMFSYFYHATAASPYNSDIAIHRKEYATAQLFLTNAMELYTALLYLINKNFIPYRKWRIYRLENLKKRPKDYAKKISLVVFGEGKPTKENLHEKQRTIIEIMNEVKSMLIQEEVDSQRLSDDIWRYEPKYLPSI